MCKFHADS